MKKENISIAMEAHKLKATKSYMQKKNLSIAEELEAALEKLYEKHVPQLVREYIDETTKEAPKQKLRAAPNEPKNEV